VNAPEGADRDEAPTIVGVATGHPDGGVAIVRVSGPRAAQIGVALAGPLPSPRRLARARLAIGQGEDALVVYMPGPHSFTGEDVIELHVHAGERNVRDVVEHVLARGARPATAGEFSRRAFERGRLGLDQAEGIAAVIGARTAAALEHGRRLVAGELGREVEDRRRAIATLRVELEAHLDFPDDVGAADVARWRGEVAGQIAGVQRWLGGFEAGRRAREVARVVLAGPPNAGKSSLFNALLGRARALVDDAPGTTRDFLEAEWEVGGRAVVLVDTAGLHPASGRVEAMGVAWARDQLEGADLLVWVEGADAPPGEAVAGVGGEVVLVESKRDRATLRPGWVGASVVGVPGVDGVRAAIAAWAGGAAADGWIGLARHRERAEEARAALERADGCLREDRGLELIAFELAIAEQRLGEITGRSSLGPVGAEILDGIFARFCIGK
jgi:tRNA modification GTPase